MLSVFHLFCNFTFFRSSGKHLSFLAAPHAYAPLVQINQNAVGSKEFILKQPGDPCLSLWLHHCDYIIHACLYDYIIVITSCSPLWLHHCDRLHHPCLPLWFYYLCDYIVHHLCDYIIACLCDIDWHGGMWCITHACIVSCLASHGATVLHVIQIALYPRINKCVPFTAWTRVTIINEQ